MIDQKIKKEIKKKLGLKKTTSVGELRALFPIGIITSKASYQRSKMFLEDLVASALPETAGAEKKELLNYVEVLGGLIDDYETKEFPVKTGAPKDILKFLMEQNDLKQIDLLKEFGSQSLVSDALSGKKEISIKQAQKLGKKFKLDPVIFLNIK
ncbi:MAG: transcriptional regulator [Epsilonproteobacteria bacterium]|nr:MAG: transcriptional regulator [Campylobacterota bacterium]